MVEKTCLVRLSPQLLSSQDPVYLSLATVPIEMQEKKKGFLKFMIILMIQASTC